LEAIGLLESLLSTKADSIPFLAADLPLMLPTGVDKSLDELLDSVLIFILAG
jgi:hypothetical protein